MELTDREIIILSDALMHEATATRIKINNPERCDDVEIAALRKRLDEIKVLIVRCIHYGG